MKIPDSGHPSNRVSPTPKGDVAIDRELLADAEEINSIYPTYLKETNQKNGLSATTQGRQGAKSLRNRVRPAKATPAVRSATAKVFAHLPRLRNA